MDRQIEKKKGLRLAFTRKAIPYWLAAVLVAFIVYLIARPHNSTQRISGDTLIISEVTRANFDDYIRVNGTVMPMTSVQISPTEGGIVQQIVAEEGTKVKAGDVILILSNENLDLQILNAEAELAEKENILRNTLISMEQQKLSVRQERLALQVEVRRTKRAYESNQQLYNERLIAREEYLKAQEDYQLAKDKLEVVSERERQDSLYRSEELQQLRDNLSNMRLNMAMIRRRKENLSVKAPIDGQIGLLDAVLGQSISAGANIGQINNLDNYKIQAQIDEHYIDRVTAGLEATFDRQEQHYNAQLRKVYPDVRDGKFKADFLFGDDLPDNIRAGQTYYLNLQLGQSEEAVLIPRGSFYQHTGGKWIYVLTDPHRAEKRTISIGRQNPQYYEVLEGLKPGEKVLTGSYDHYGENEVLVIGD
ncbi:MAG: HlyD family efflux transporter periplasmic adaptor subunit [Bacteroidales bacterium]|nr:HlyD family efflux transporter periplasmic adaptor subunit [Bacteroidales bacterium]